MSDYKRPKTLRSRLGAIVTAICCIVSLVMLSPHGAIAATTVTLDPADQVNYSESMLYHFYDHTGSLLDTLDEFNEPVLRQSWNAWGERSFHDGKTLSQAAYDGLPVHQGFTGHKSIVNGDFVFAGDTRLYDPSIKRFLNTDDRTTGGIRGENHFSYAYNNPLAYVDPDGHIPLMELQSFTAYLMVASGAYAFTIACTVSPSMKFCHTAKINDKMTYKQAAWTFVKAFSQNSGVFAVAQSTVGGICTAVTYIPVPAMQRHKDGVRYFRNGCISATKDGLRIGLSSLKLKEIELFDTGNGRFGLGKMVVGPNFQYLLAFTTINSSGQIYMMHNNNLGLTSGSVSLAIGYSFLQGVTDKYFMGTVENRLWPTLVEAKELDNGYKTLSRLSEVVPILLLDLAHNQNARGSMTRGEVGLIAGSSTLYQLVRIGISSTVFEPPFLDNYVNPLWGRSIAGTSTKLLTGIVGVTNYSPQ